MIYVAIVLGLVALIELAIFVKIASIVEEVDRIMAQLMYATTLLQAVDHKVSNEFGCKDGYDEYFDELVREQYDKMEREKQKEQI